MTLSKITDLFLYESLDKLSTIFKGDHIMKTTSFQSPITRGLSTLAVILSFLVTQGALITQANVQAAPLAAVVTVGAGSYNTTLPAGRLTPSNSAGTAVSPKRTASLTGPMPTNDWWSSLGFQRNA